MPFISTAMVDKLELMDSRIWYWGYLRGHENCE